MRTKITGIILLTCITTLLSKEIEQDSLKLKLEGIKSLYAQKNKELEQSSHKRWSARQDFVLQKESNRVTIENCQKNVERMYSEISRLREEKLSRESIIISLEEKLERESNKWKQLTTIIASKRQAASDKLTTGFPLDYEKNLQKYVTVDHAYPNERYSAEKFIALIKIRTEHFLSGMKNSVTEKTIIDDQGDPLEMQVLRIGRAVAMGVTDSSHYYLNYLGKGVSRPFKWSEVTDEYYAEMVNNSISSAVETTSETQVVYVDILQNQQSQDMLTGNQQSKLEKVGAFIKAGGFISLPLGILLFVAILLIINRIVVYHYKHSRSDRFIEKTIDYLDNNKLDGAYKFAKSDNSVLARILEGCLDHQDYSRERVEQFVKEVLMTEVPKLEKHLDTLAVIAAAAPLLGLLGTVTGMITMFESITRFGTGDPSLLAGGISEALVTTEMGLIIAIPVLLIHTFLRNNRNHIQGDLEMYSMMILNRLWPAE